jgi:Zn finger protein HypA/HybF involved in hydrogenase expression
VRKIVHQCEENNKLAQREFQTSARKVECQCEKSNHGTNKEKVATTCKECNGTNSWKTLATHKETNSYTRGKNNNSTHGKQCQCK